jgi:RNA polymerase sigma-70 factor (sigma-E family)
VNGATITREAGIGGRSLEHLYQEHGPRALRVAFLMTGDERLAEDLVQDAFVRIAGSFRHLRSTDAFGAYLNRTVINLAKDSFRRNVVEGRYLKAEAQRAEPMAAPDLGRRDEIVEALRELPHRQRAAVVLRYLEDMSEQGVADQLGCCLSAAKSLITRGMETLRARMEVRTDD